MKFLIIIGVGLLFLLCSSYIIHLIRPSFHYNATSCILGMFLYVVINFVGFIYDEVKKEYNK